MVKLSVILFAIFYLQILFGISAGIHSCNGKIEYIRFFVDLGNCHHEQTDNQTDSCDKDEDSESCCDERTFHYQAGSEQVIIQKLRYSFENCYHFFSETKGNDNDVLCSCMKIIDRNDYLIPSKTRPYWLLNCSLTYYG